MSAELSNTNPGHPIRPGLVRVWDPAVRLFHWSLVAAFGVAFFLEAGTRIHEIAGYTVLGLVAFRVVWGFAGSRHARFADFVRPPGQVLAYVKDIVRLRAPRFIGHNPAGGLMILALLAMVGITGLSGWAMTTDLLWGSDWIEELHEGAAMVTLGLIGLHVAGVVVASLQHRENLFVAMLSGLKRRS